MTRPKMYVSSDFFLEEGATLQFVGCTAFPYSAEETGSVNLFVKSFKGENTFEGWDIFTEDEPVVFLDKVESYITGERIIS